MADRLTYVYGIVHGDFDLAGAPPGLESAAVTVIREGAVGALASVLDAEDYAPEVLERRAGELHWIGPRAEVHDRVLTWASDAGAVAPLPMLSLFSDAAAVRAMLRERGSQLGGALQRVAAGREYALRVFRVDAELAPHLAELSSQIAELEARAGSASPGQRYLLARKIEAERKTESRRVGAAVARATHDALAPLALAAATEPLPTRATSGDASDADLGVAVLNAFYLVAPQGLETFRAEVTKLVERYEPRGFRFAFTGPWPAYHFVSEAGGGR
jgi:hypothetical protein